MQKTINTNLEACSINLYTYEGGVTAFLEFVKLRRNFDKNMTKHFNIM